MTLRPTVPLLRGAPPYQGGLAHLLSESGMPFSTSQDATPPSRTNAPSAVKPSWIFQSKVVCSCLCAPMAQCWVVYSCPFGFRFSSDTHICCLGYVISAFETQNVCPHAFLFLAVPNKGSLHMVCTRQYLLWEDEVRLEECF